MIAPVFTYRWQLWLFTGTLFFFLVLPFLPKPEWMSRDILYNAIYFNKKNSNTIYSAILRDPRDIDILFVGSSTMTSGVNALQVRAALRGLTDHEPVVYTIYHPKAGFDLDYILIKDILSRKKVKLLVWDGLRPPKENPGHLHHADMFLWDMRLHAELIDNVPQLKTDIYLYSVMTGLKLILSPVLDRGDIIPERPEYFICSKTHYLGACMRREAEQLAVNLPEAPALSLDRILHFRGLSPVLKPSSHTPYTRLDRKLLPMMLALAEEHHTALAFMITPIANSPDNVILAQRIARGQAGWDVPVIGATMADFYPKRRLRHTLFQNDDFHLIYQAASQYTYTVMPAILHLYRQATTTGITLPPAPEQNDAPGR